MPVWQGRHRPTIICGDSLSRAVLWQTHRPHMDIGWTNRGDADEKTSTGYRKLTRNLRRCRRLWPAVIGPIGAFLSVAVVLAGLGGGTAPAAAASELLAFAARVAGDEYRTRIVVDFDRKPDVSIHYVDSPPRVLVDLPATAFTFPRESLEPRGLFKHIRYGAMGPGRARIVLGSDEPVRIETNKVVESESGNTYRLVLDGVKISDEAFAELLKSQDWSPESASGKAGDKPIAVAPDRDDRFTVVIDPGHGGIDSGALGVSGTLEKDVTLGFAKAFRDALKARNIRVFLTRDDDEFLTLSDRVRFGREHGADLFVSIHADSISLKSIRGATVYTLSDKASDRMAAAIAEHENEADEVAGISIEDEPDGVADILIDLTRRETQVFSIGLAEKIVAAFDGDIRLINNPHRYAGFRVLKAPDVPSVLVELGYLSNPEDEKLLTDPEWREKVAGLLTQSVLNYRSTVLASGN